MTRRQMLARFRKLGGKNLKNALLITARKYYYLPKYWDKILVEYKLRVYKHCPNNSNCGLCEVFFDDNGGACSRKCPLAKDDCYEEGSLYQKVAAATINGDKISFGVACENMVKFLRKKLEGIK